MKKRSIFVLNAVLIVLLLASSVFAENLEPIKSLNISPIAGAAGSVKLRIFAMHEEYDYKPDPTRDIKASLIQGELSMKLIEQVGIGITVPYHFIENQNLYSGMPAGTGRDENGLGNVTAGVSVSLPDPSEGINLVVGANTVLPTSEKKIGRKISALEPYAIILTRDGDLSFTASAGYELIIDENAPPGEPDSIYDDVLTLQGSAIYSANEMYSFGGQFLMTSARNTSLDFLPQMRVATDTVEWGMAIEIPIADNHPQVNALEKNFGLIFDAAVKF